MIQRHQTESKPSVGIGGGHFDATGKHQESRRRLGSSSPKPSENFFQKTEKTFEKPLDIFFKIVYNITVAFKRHARVAELADAHV